jgi:hypothetical protein
VSELLLRNLRRHSEVVEKGRMDVAELMPRHNAPGPQTPQPVATRASAASIPGTARPFGCRTRDRSAPSGLRHRDTVWRGRRREDPEECRPSADARRTHVVAGFPAGALATTACGGFLHH